MEENSNKVVGKRGIVYISRVPPLIKPDQLRHILSQKFGNITRYKLKEEDDRIKQKILKKRGKTPRKYACGWFEFEYKVHAKDCERALNGNVLEERGRWGGDIMAVTYLRGYKWKHLEAELEKKRSQDKVVYIREQKKASEEAKRFLKHTKAKIVSKKKIINTKREKSKDE